MPASLSLNHASALGERFSGTTSTQRVISGEFATAVLSDRSIWRFLAEVSLSGKYFISNTVMPEEVRK